MTKGAIAFACVLGLAVTGCGLGLESAVIVERPDLRVVRLTAANANVFVVEQNGKRLMIDAGNPGDEAEYERLMRDLGIEPETIDFLLLTHGHLDHAGTAAHFQGTYGIRVLGGAGDLPMIERQGKSEVCPTGLLARLILRMGGARTYPAFELDSALDGAFDLASLGMQGSVLPWPGHTPGSVVAIFGEDAFVGDLIRGGILDPERPATHFFMCDLEENRLRIRELLERPGITRWHPGHFGPLRVEAVRRYLAD